MGHIVHHRLGHVPYRVAYEIRAVQDIPGTTRSSISNSNFDQGIDRGDFFDLKQPYPAANIAPREYSGEYTPLAFTILTMLIPVY